MEDNIINELYKEVPVDIKPGGQGFKYVKTKYVIDRLNKAFGNDWGTEVMSIETIDDEVLVKVRLSAYPYGIDKPALVQEGFGSAKKFNNSEIGNITKSALSKAIKNAARNWGVGLFLEDDDDSSANSTGNVSRTAPPQMPNMGMGGNVNSSQGNVPPTNVVKNVPTTPSMPSTPPTNVPSMPSMPNVPSMPSTPPVSETTPTGLPPMGMTPPSSQGSVQPPPESAVVQNAGVTKLTPVQKVAIESRLQEKGLNFEQVAGEFYTSLGKVVPATIEDVEYNDAISFVTMLNSK